MAGFIGNVTFDCADPVRLARFWVEVLDYELEFDEGDDSWAAANKPVTRHPRLYFQKVPEPKTVKNRVHIDVNVVDMEAEVEKLIGLGAQKLRLLTDGGEMCTVMADPEGNEFCVQPQH